MMDRGCPRKRSNGSSSGFTASTKPVRASRGALGWDFPLSNISSRAMVAAYGPAASREAGPAFTSHCLWIPEASNNLYCEGKNKKGRRRRAAQLCLEQTNTSLIQIIDD